MQTTSMFPGAVTVDSLLTAIRSAVDSGRIGTPVSVRLHWQCSETFLQDAVVLAVRITDEALALEQSVWRVRNDPAGRFLNVLGKDCHGRTLLVTVCQGAAPEFALTVFGNHGVLRLEHAGLDVSLPEARETAEPEWRQGLLQAMA